MGREVVAAGAEIRDLAQLGHGAVAPVRGRDKGFQVNEFIGAAVLAIRAADVVGIPQRGAVGVSPAPAGMLRGGTAMDGGRSGMPNGKCGPR